MEIALIILIYVVIFMTLVWGTFLAAGIMTYFGAKTKKIQAETDYQKSLLG